MTRQEILDEIANVLNINADKLNFNSDYTNTNGWDSLAITNIIISIENKFDIDIDIDDAEQFISVSQIIKILEEKYK